MGRPKKDEKDKTIIRSLSVKPDISEMFNKQAKEQGLAYSEYFERLVLEKHYSSHEGNK